MKKSVISLMTAAILPFAFLTNTIAIAKDDNTATFGLSSYIDETFSKKHEKSEVDESLFDNFLKYSLLVTNKDSLSAEELEICHKIFETERTYMPYITCPYARETIKNGIAPPRVSTDDQTLLVAMGDPTFSRTEKCYAYYPDIVYTCFDYNDNDRSEYWLDSSGTERLICDYSTGFSPAYEKIYNEKPDWEELDRLAVLCWAGGELIERDGSYMYAGEIDGRRFKDSLSTETIASGIWEYQLLEDGSAFIVDCTLPKYSKAEPIEEPVVLPSNLDGHEVYGIGNALTGTGITKLIIPENYKNVRFLSNMDYLEEIEVNAPELTLKYILSDCPNLRSAVLNVKSIESYALSYCDKLESLEIKAAEGIACDAFTNLPSLSQVTLPENLRYIGQDAFSNTSVTELVIPKSVEIVGALKNPYIYRGEIIDPLTADRIMIADEGCVIKSYYDSEAHRYAIANDCRFSPLDDIQYGDVNDDGEFNISDVVLLQKWLLSVHDTQLTNWKEADLCADGRLDVFDLCLMKQRLIE